MQIKNYTFSNTEIEKLEQYRDSQSNFTIKTRFIAMLMIAKGVSRELIASIIGNSVYTIEYWFKLYIEQGIDRLNTLNYTPKQSYLNQFQINQVIIYVSFENPRNIKQVQEYIKQKFEISYCDDAVRKILKKHGLKVIRPKKVPANPPSVEVQEKFIEDYKILRESLPPNDVIFFTDAMHLIHQAVPSLCWGNPHFPPILPTNSGRCRLNILGAYNPIDHTFIHFTGEKNCNTESVIKFLDLIIKSNPQASSITLYRDNAKYFMSQDVIEWLKNHPKLNIVPLPTYAPNLNLIERFWKFAKEKLVKNKYVEKYKTFRAKVFQFLNHVDVYIDELKTLMVEKFEIVYAK